MVLDGRHFDGNKNDLWVGVEVLVWVGIDYQQLEYDLNIVKLFSLRR